MSYCRWSTDDFQCDLYCYGDCSGGFTTHVACNKVIFKEPLPEPAKELFSKEWLARYNYVMHMVDEAERIPLDFG